MKIKKLLKKIFNEEWVDMVGKFDIFVNPTSKELMGLEKEYHYIRFILDNETKKLYVFSHNFLHKEASRHLKVDYSKYNTEAIFGAGIYKKGKLKIIELSGFSLIKKVLGKNPQEKWGWAEKYLNIVEVANHILKYNTMPEINEEFLDYIKNGFGTPKEVFVNPTSKEVSELYKDGKTIRFIVDNKNKKLYLFSSNLLHSIVTEKYGLPYKNLSNTEDYFYGEGIILQGTNIKIHGSFNLDALILYAKQAKNSRETLHNFFSNDIEKKWGWVDKYKINVTEYLKKAHDFCKSRGILE